MFGNKKCPECDRKIKKDFEFCPYCGTNFKNPLEDRENYGLIGTSDNVSELGEMFNGIMRPGILDKMVSSLLKNLEKEMKMPREIAQENSNSIPKINSNFELFINGKKINLPGNIAGLQIEKMPTNPNAALNSKTPKKQRIPQLSEETLLKSSKLPRKEAESKLTRTADKIIYEIKTPGLNSLNNVLVNQLENSIEVKIYTPKAVYHKNLSVKLPLVRYYLKEDNLFLEFKAKN